MSDESTFEWNPAWGTPEESQIDTSLTSYEGFKPGDKVEAANDGDEDDGEFWFTGDTGVIIGFAPLTFDHHPSRTEIIVVFDGMDPTGVKDPLALNHL